MTSLFTSRPSAARHALAIAGSHFRAARHLALGLDCFGEPLPAEVAQQFWISESVAAAHYVRLARRTIRESWRTEQQDVFVARKVREIVAGHKRPVERRRAA